jgi:SAM-dependent methyltransferase
VTGLTLADRAGLAAAYARFPPGFFDRFDDEDDADFYRPTRLVTHIDDAAIASVGDLYAELGVCGDVLDLMSSWVSHFAEPPRRLVALGMNAAELEANEAADERVVHDLNRRPELPFGEGTFDDVVCCVSVDYLVRPLEVFAEVRRILRPGGRFVCTFSNRCFPTKAIGGWLGLGGRQRMDLVGLYFDLVGGWGTVTKDERTAVGAATDPLYAVWAPAWAVQGASVV